MLNILCVTIILEYAHCKYFKQFKRALLGGPRVESCESMIKINLFELLKVFYKKLLKNLPSFFTAHIEYTKAINKHSEVIRHQNEIALIAKLYYLF